MQLHNLMVGSSPLRGNGTAGLTLHAGVTGRKADKYGLERTTMLAGWVLFPFERCPFCAISTDPSRWSARMSPARGLSRLRTQMVYSQPTDLPEGHRKCRLPPVRAMMGQRETSVSVPLSACFWCHSGTAFRIPGTLRTYR